MFDALCAHCGYDLVGLPRAGACPECGRPFDKSARRGLDVGDAAGLRHRASSRRLTLACFLAAALLVAAGALWSAVSSQPIRPLVVGFTLAAALTLVGIGRLCR